MKIILLASTALLMFFGCSSHKSASIELRNPMNIARADELVVLKRPALEKITGPVPEGKYIILSRSYGSPLVLQYDDLNKDGIWDEAAFLYSFQPNEAVKLKWQIADAPATVKAVVRAHVRQRRKNADNSFAAAVDRDSIPAGQPATDFSKDAYPPFLTEGPAWENDKVGFRLYFDVRNGKDIWGKTTAAMVLDEVGTDTANNYHALADWGMDILKVGNSLGAGSLALYVPLNGKDSLLRLGGELMGPVQYEKIADGPVRAIFRMHYPQWKPLANEPAIAVTDQMSIWGGQYFYQSEVKLEGAPAGAALVTGIVNLHSQASYTGGNDAIDYLYTYDLQSENHDSLGMALMLPHAIFGGTGQTLNDNTDITHTYTLKIKTGLSKANIFRFYAGWEQSDTAFKSKQAFASYLQTEAEKWAHPIEID